MSRIWETDGLSSVRREEGICDINEHECKQLDVCGREGGRKGEVGARVYELIVQQ